MDTDLMHLQNQELQSALMQKERDHAEQQAKYERLLRLISNSSRATSQDGDGDDSGSSLRVGDRPQRPLEGGWEVTIV